jgi:SAM-dependent methyltransferase
LAADRSRIEIELGAVLRSTTQQMGPVDAAILETFVVPRYLCLFGELALEMLAEGEEAQVAHLDCTTGYPDRGIAMKLVGAHIYGVDPSMHAVELAKAKASTMPEMVSDYRSAEGYPVPLPAAAFSHALSLQCPARLDGRARLLAELARLLAPQGQAIVTMPVRGSFQEILDLLREFAVRTEDTELATAIELATLVRPTPDAFALEMEGAGFDYVDVTTRLATLSFRSGRDFFEDPVTRLMLLPELRDQLNVGDAMRAFAYVREAIDKYWSDGTFELTVNVGCATGRRLPGW